MSTEMSLSEIQSFYEFLGRRLREGGDELTPERSVEEFRAYQEEVRRLRSQLAASHDQFVRGDARELDLDAIIDRVRNRLGQ